MNPNIRLSEIFIDTLVEAGLTDVVICPGSRSTPLTLVSDAHPELRTHLSLDERSGAFFALGLALKSERPVALICTSGTAAANFFPAIIEANMSQVPLLVLTADRPPELRHSGANQTIDQVKMFGDHVLWAVDMALPTAEMADVAWRNVATTASRAFAQANGARKGVVHINFPFRKPLEPAGGYRLERERHRWDVGKIQHPAPTELQRRQKDRLAQWFDRYERGLIICGPNCPAGDFPDAVTNFALQSGYPIFADPLSNVRFGSAKSDLIVGGYEVGLANGRMPDWEPPDIVIRFGAVPTSKWLNTYLSKVEPTVQLHVRSNGVWADDSHLVTDFWPVDEVNFCRKAGEIARNYSWERRKVPPGLAWQRDVFDWEASIQREIREKMELSRFDAAFLYDLVTTLDEDGANIFIGNSLPVRHLDAFAPPSAQPLRIYGNRGASGIDGVVSTACGIAAADPSVPTILIIGDVSFYHDMNGLLAARDLPNLKIVLFNNNSGSIFRRLPIAQFEEPFERLFLTPHDLDFTHVARLYELDFARFTGRESFADRFQQVLTNGRPSLLEIVTDGGDDEQARRAFVGALVAAV